MVQIYHGRHFRISLLSHHGYPLGISAGQALCATHFLVVYLLAYRCILEISFVAYHSSSKDKELCCQREGAGIFSSSTFHHCSIHIQRLRRLLPDRHTKSSNCIAYSASLILLPSSPSGYSPRDVNRFWTVFALCSVGHEESSISCAGRHIQVIMIAHGPAFPSQ